MWILGLIILIGGLLTMLAVPRIKDEAYKAWFQFVVLILTVFGVSIILTSHHEPVTNIINDYHSGKIIKCEEIMIEGTDTLWTVKYKYK